MTEFVIIAQNDDGATTAVVVKSSSARWAAQHAAREVLGSTYTIINVIESQGSYKS